MSKLLSGYTGPNFLPPYSCPDKDGANHLILSGDAGRFDFSGSGQGTTHRVNFCLPWEGVGPFLQYALNVSVPPSGGVLTYTRSLPMLSPFAAIFPNTYATSYSGAGDGLDENVSESRLFEDCLITLEFSTLPFGTDGSQAYIEINYQGSANYVTIPSAIQTFSNGDPIDHDGGALVGQLNIQATVHQIPDPASFISTAMPLKGKVSSADVTLDGFTYPAGSLLFPTFDLSKSVDSNGNRTATATLQLIQRDTDWNSGVRSDGVVDTISPAPYQTADLNGLFS